MKQSLYLETSVIGAYLDNGEPFRRDLTIRWWEHEMPDYRAVVSPLVSRELERVAEPHRSSYLNLISSLEQVELTEEVSILADGYVLVEYFIANTLPTLCTWPSPLIIRLIT